MRSVTAIIGMQYGSEAKGALAGYLAHKNQVDTVVCNWSPNAGHTFRYKNLKLVTSIVPIGAWNEHCERIIIGPGAVFDPVVLMQEIELIKNFRLNVYRRDIHAPDIYIHPNATIVSQDHRNDEAKYITLGSTMKGSAQAVIDRMNRTEGTQNIAMNYPWEELLDTHYGVHIGNIYINYKQYTEAWFRGINIQIEGCQGHSLSINSHFYPYSTSRDCSIWQLLSDVRPAVPILQYLTIYGAVRTHPIRVANRGKSQEYTSGDSYDDQTEISFEQLGVETEYTTVTKLPRRVFTFSTLQVLEAIQMNTIIHGQLKLYASFMDYIEPDEREGYLASLNRLCPVSHYSVGPEYHNMKEYR